MQNFLHALGIFLVVATGKRTKGTLLILYDVFTSFDDRVRATVFPQ